MIELQKEELLEIRGGFSPWILVGIGGAITFIIGVIDGFVRPLKCR